MTALEDILNKASWGVNDESANYYLADAKDQIKALLSIVEKYRVDGMFIEWNGLNLADIEEIKKDVDSL